MSLEQYSKLSLSQQRQVGAIVGAVVADAAVSGYQWQYDRRKIKSALRQLWRSKSPEFLQQQQSPICHIQAGDNSCYGDLVQCTLSTLSTLQPEEELLEKLKNTSLKKWFGRGSPYYRIPLWIKSIGGALCILIVCTIFTMCVVGSKPTITAIESPFVTLVFSLLSLGISSTWLSFQSLPLEGKWLHTSVSTHLRTGRGSKLDANPDGLCLALPLIVTMVHEDSKSFSTRALSINHILHAGQPLVDTSMLLFARILKKVVNDSTGLNENQTFVKHVEDILEEIETNHSHEEIRLPHCNIIASKIQSGIASSKKESPASLSFLSASGPSGMFPNVLRHAVASTLHYGNSFVGLTRHIALGGGDACAIAVLAGAFTGALHGIGGTRGVPVSWIDRTNSGRYVLQLAMQIIAQTTSEE